MKKTLLIGSAALLASSMAMAAIDAPKIEGRLNNEMRYSDLVKHGDASFDTLKTVGNNPNILKATGKVGINENMNVTYAFELGFQNGRGQDYKADTQKRQSMASLNTQFGSLVMGQTYTPSVAITSFDALSTTGAGLGGSDTGMSNFGEATHYMIDGIGYAHQLFQDVIGYKGKFGNFSIYGVVGNENNNQAKSEWYDVAAFYNVNNLRTMLGYMHNAGLSTYTGAASYKLNAIKLGAGFQYTAMDKGNIADVRNVEEKTKIMRGFLSADWTKDAHKVAMTFGLKKIDPKHDESNKLMQVAAGYTYSFNANVSANVNVQYIDGDKIDLGEIAGNTEAYTKGYQAATGLRVTF